jgi:DNA-binding transcriptional LysR family regulator
MRDRLPEMSDIYAFLLVAEELSFRKAADRLLIDQSVLSRRIRNFEERIGFSLFSAQPAMLSSLNLGASCCLG